MVLKTLDSQTHYGESAISEQAIVDIVIQTYFGGNELDT